MIKKIPGPALCGFADFFIGAAPSRKATARKAPPSAAHKAAPAARHVPSGSRYVAPGTLQKGAFDHKASIAHARAVAKKSARVASKLKNFKSPQPKGVKRPALPPHVAGVFNPSRTAARFAARYGRHALPSDAQIQKLAAELATTAKKLGGQADTHATKITAAKKTLDSAVGKLRSKTDPSRRSGVVLGTGVFLGLDVFVGDDPALDPSLQSTDDSGAYSDGAASPLPTDGSLPPGPDENYGLPPAPTSPPPLTPGVDFAPDETFGGGYAVDQTFYTFPSNDQLPLGAVIYDGTRQWNHLDVGSRVAYYGDTGAGTGEGVEPEDPNAMDYQAGAHFRGGFRWHNDGWWYNWGGDNQRPNSAERGSLAIMSDASSHHHWGPLIGNPQTDFKGLRYNATTNTWFWPYDVAPSWAIMVSEQARFAKAALDYQAQLAQAKADYLSAVAQAKADAASAAAQTRQDTAAAAQQARDLAAAQAAADVSMTQSDAAAYAAQQQTEREQAQLDIEAQKADLQMRLMQAQADAQAAAQGGGGYYTDDSGGGGSGDDDTGGDAGGDDAGGESDAQAEVADLEQEEALGAGIEIMLRKRRMEEEGNVDASGTAIGLDEWGNVVD